MLALQSSKPIVIGTGPAGSGKTMLACQVALEHVAARKVVLTRPIVAADEELGFLPGDMDQKMEPWTRPLFDVLHEYYSPRETAKMLEEQIIEISPLAFMRGRTFKNAYIVADEMQNATPGQMKMLLTRIGEGTKIVVTGDVEQTDKNKSNNGLFDLYERLCKNNVNKISVCEFDTTDIQRHRIISDVLNLYN